MKVLTMIFAGLFCTATFAQVNKIPPAQQSQQMKEITDAELKTFVQAYQGIQVANQEAQKEMIAAVEEQDLDVGTFNKIHQATIDNEEVDASKETEVAVDSLNKAEEIPVEAEPEPVLKVSFLLDSLQTASDVDSLRVRFSEEEQKIIFALNRIEPVRVGPGTNLVVPDTLMNDFLVYAPFPKQLNIIDTIPKAVLINQRVQAFALYEKGTLVRWGPVSSGKQSTPTPNGLHYGNYKAKHKISTVNEDWKLPYYFNFMNFEGVGVHQYLLPGFPASHACVRLPMEDAQFIYDWAKQWQLDPSGNTVIKHGTPFMVFGEYDYEKPFPWLRLAEDPDSNGLTPQEFEVLEVYVQDYLKDDRNFIKTDDESKGLRPIA